MCEGQVYKTEKQRASSTPIQGNKRPTQKKTLWKADCDKKRKSHRTLSLILQFTSKNLI